MKKFIIEKTTVEGVNTYVTIMDIRTAEIFEGHATCCDADEFDFKIGQKIAYQRACIKANKAYGDYLESEQKKLAERIAQLRESFEKTMDELQNLNDEYSEAQDDEYFELVSRQDALCDLIGH